MAYINKTSDTKNIYLSIYKHTKKKLVHSDQYTKEITINYLSVKVQFLLYIQLLPHLDPITKPCHTCLIIFSPWKIGGFPVTSSRKTTPRL